MSVFDTTGKKVYEGLKGSIGEEDDYKKLWNHIKSCAVIKLDRDIWERFQSAPDYLLQEIDSADVQKMLKYMAQNPNKWSSPPVKEILDRVLSRYIEHLRDREDSVDSPYHDATIEAYDKYVKQGKLGNPLERLKFELKSKFEKNGHYNLEAEYTKHKNRQLLKGSIKPNDPTLTNDDKTKFTKYLTEFNSEVKQWLDSDEKKEKLTNVIYYIKSHTWWRSHFDDTTQKDWYLHFFRAMINWQHYKLIHVYFNDKHKNIDQDHTNWITYKWWGADIQDNWQEISGKIRQAKIDWPLFYTVWKSMRPKKKNQPSASSHTGEHNYIYNYYGDNQDLQSIYLSDHNDMVYSPQSQFEYQYGLVLNQPRDYSVYNSVDGFNDNYEGQFGVQYLSIYIGFIFIVIAICLCLVVLVSIIGYLLGLKDRNKAHSRRENKYLSMKYYGDEKCFIGNESV